MDRLSKIMTTSALALAFALPSSPAWADGTPQCNDSAFEGTECGTNSNAADFATAVGNMANASGDGSVAVGHTARAPGFVAVAIGQAALASGDNATAVGFLAQATGTGATATGAGARAEGQNSIATGINANANGMGAIATGADSVALGDGNIAIGDAAQATGATSIAIGQGATATNEDATAIGTMANATGFHSTALGARADATAIGATALGWNSSATGARSTAVGNSAVASGPNSTALGQGAVASANNSVALGMGSVATQANTVSVGTVGGERRIVNVAAGINATDAVNVSQLNAMNGSVVTERRDRIAGDVALGRMIRAEAGRLRTADFELGARIDGVEFDMRRDRRQARSGTAAALAAAGMPQAMDPGRSMISAGVGTYRGRSAISVGGSHRVANGSSVFKVGVTYDSTEHVGANAGVGFQF
jgi:autotransporter adhesin